MIRPWKYEDNKLKLDNISIKEISANCKTPFYVYSESFLIKSFKEFEQSSQQLPYQVITCYALKANPHPQIVKSLASLGSGADVVSIGELKRALESHVPANKIVFSGVGKTYEELKFAIEQSILAINVESLEEIDEINQIAKELNKNANVCIRFNPMVESKTHHHISTGFKTHKFGILKSDILKAFQEKKYLNINFVGLSVHIGSQLLDLEATAIAAKEVVQLSNILANKFNIKFKFLDFGGGLGVDYSEEERARHPGVDQYFKKIADALANLEHKIESIVFEPGRYIVARCGVLVTTVLRNKHSEDNHFVIVDGGMNDFVRSSLYDAYHEVLSEKFIPSNEHFKQNVVGPICESADSFAKGRILPPFNKGDLLIICDTGAYGRSMASNYNMREFPKELFIEASGKIHWP